MSTPMPIELEELVSRLDVPSVYLDKFSRLFSSLPKQLYSPFFNRLAFLLTPVHNSLPSVLTSPLPRDLNVPPHFPAYLTEFTSRVTIILGIMATIITLTIPSKDLGDLCTRYITSLHNGLYVDAPSYLNDFIIILTDEMIVHPEAQPYSALTRFPLELFSVLRNIPPYKICFKHPLSEELNKVLKDLIHEMHQRMTYLYEEMIEYLSHNLMNIHEAPDFDIDRITVPHVYQATGDTHTGTDKCYICLEKIKDGDYARRLHCFHNYHLECIDPCLKTKRSCPLCRTCLDETFD